MAAEAEQQDADVVHPELRPTKYMRWFIDRGCPERCSAASWKKVQKCESYSSEEACRERYKQHLMNSEHHWFEEEVADEKCHLVVVTCEEVPEKEARLWEEWEQSEKREQHDDWTNEQKKAKVPRPPAHPPPAAKAAPRNESPLAEDAMRNVLSTLQRGLASSSSSGSSGSASMPQEKLKQIHDHLERACNGVKSARDMAEGAAAAFDFELKKLKEITRELKDII